ncbi:hypothetical protein J18TS1_12680 [Oceanobacillus oncorhynchi subsp. incaldanensis]|uniref:hypothetical protein n=1 Tax=Oceanobacillus oncorhynchi TaxID=545501 RepID=UPI001B17CBC0|nr:hypothetical protein [Oceanobacillus oncorhynchi]GIO18168.1 hypothetical protein J18TS1_12680 [Oceanobacillus oncorhynchi subsp. incaldanensis]
MMNNYEFKETGSRNIERDGEQVRLVSFRGNSPIEGDDRERLNIDGAIVVPMMDYFQAGMNGAIPELIKNKVVDRLTARETENAE